MVLYFFFFKDQSMKPGTYILIIIYVPDETENIHDFVECSFVKRRYSLALNCMYLPAVFI